MEPSVQFNSPDKPGILQPKIVLFLVAVLIIIGGLIYYFYPQKTNPIQKQIEQLAPEKPPPLINLSSDPDKAIAKVGEEIIYQKDINMELSAQPSEVRSQDLTIKYTLEKIASDSAILQGGKADGLITLDKSVFNSLDKDYFKRLKLVKDTKKQVSDKADGVKGALVSIWFNNNFNLGKNNIDQRKQIALEKITKLHDDVKSKKITIEQAGEVIKNDSSLKAIDPAYQVNAYTAFDTAKQTRIFFDEEINNTLLKLNIGEVSGVLLGFDKYTDGKKYEALYVFGQVKQVVSQGQFQNFDSWLKTQLAKYEIKYY